MSDETKVDIDAMFEGMLRPLHSRNARLLFDAFYENRAHDYLTTHDLEKMLEGEGLGITKKEINAWLVSLQEASLIAKLEGRGKPVASEYGDRYTFDLWKLTETGFNLRRRLPKLMSPDTALPKLSAMTPKLVEELEDLYLTAKILLTLDEYGGSMNYLELREKVALDREKLAVYSWPDASHSEKPLFEVKVKPPSLRGRVFKLFGQVVEQDLTFSLTDAGRDMAKAINANAVKPET